MAEEISVNGVMVDLKPEGIVETVRELKEKYGAVTMVGDGINDASALAQPTIAVAMGTTSADVAIEAGEGYFPMKPQNLRLWLMVFV